MARTLECPRGRLRAGSAVAIHLLLWREGKVQIERRHWEGTVFMYWAPTNRTAFLPAEAGRPCARIVRASSPITSLVASGGNHNWPPNEQEKAA